ncbi:MAG: DMT family transporter [Mesorhizobium sp.]|nr:DMT family transporter [Mesorhizobium sp.]MBL8578532.1 DMT family transporter [Mesorhizobium sp.]
MPLSPNMRASLFMTVSMAGFTLNDAITKYIAESMNMGQVMLLRGTFATAFIAVLAWHQGALANLRLALEPLVLVRVLCEALATITFLIALANLPIANVSAVLQALPLGVTMGAALVYGETVGWRRWLSIAVGFVGVAIIVRPGLDGFSFYSLVTLLCVVFCVIRDLATRRIPERIPTLLVSTATAAAVTLCGGVLVVPMGGWNTPDVSTLALLAVAAGLLLIGYQFIIHAVRDGDISFVAPFRYTSLLFSILLGFVMFNDIPDLPMIIGSAIIVGSGLYMLYRERVVGRSKAASESVGPGMTVDGL